MPRETLWPSKPRTLIKHQIYRHYLQCWMGKICSVFDNASVVDMYAGPGIYSDGLDGSSIVVARTFLNHVRRDSFRRLNLLSLEKRSDRLEYLRGRLAKLPRVHNLSIVPPILGDARERLDEVYRIVHGDRGAAAPVLWIIDPFDFAGAPFEMVRRCLSAPRDEVIITWFVDEVYRFCEDPTKAAALDRYFGGSHWRRALGRVGEHARKEALTKAYEDGIKQLRGTYTRSIAISVKNETPRYRLVYATHSDKGLECFNPVAWKIDPVLGRSISEKRGLRQGDLFAESPYLNALRSFLEELAGKSISFSSLSKEAGRLGFTEAHLRTALDDLANEGRAIREEPLKARKKWPSDSLVRFYGSHAEAEEEDEQGGT